jgi:putative ABC transport system substrate-binding protein
LQSNISGLGANMIGYRRSRPIWSADGWLSSSLPVPATRQLRQRAATSTIPIVFATGSDPARTGLVASMNRPGGNVTGVSFINSELVQKRIELLHELVPQSAIIALLVNPNNDDIEIIISDAREAARALGRQIEVFKAGNNHDIDTAFANMIQLQAGALLIMADPFFNSRSRQLGAKATRNALPALYSLRDFAAGGGLIGFGPNQVEAYSQAGSYVGRILKGEKPADLPVMQPTKFEFVINLKTAKTLGVEIPLKLQALRDDSS